MDLGGPRQAENLHTGFISNFNGRRTIYDNFIFWVDILFTEIGVAEGFSLRDGFMAILRKLSNMPVLCSTTKDENAVVA